MRAPKLLVAIDDSSPSDGAITFALQRAKMRGADLVIVHAFNRGAVAARACGPYGAINPYPMVSAMECEAKSILARAAARAVEEGVGATTQLLEGQAPDKLLEYCREQAVNEIVIGTHARSGLARLAFGSVAEALLRGSKAPTFIVPKNAVVPTALRTILVALDGSQTSNEAAHYALKLAESERAEIVCCSVVDPASLQWYNGEYGYDPEHCIAEASRETDRLLAEHVGAATRRGVAARSILRFGNAAEEILAGAKEVGADLILVGTHGRTGLRRLLLGSVAEGVLRKSGVPVCAIHPAQHGTE